MMATLQLLAATGLLLATIQWLRYAEQRRALSEMRSYRLRFPRDADPAAAVRLVAGLAGLRPAWWRRWLYVPTVVLEAHAVRGRIEHYLALPERSDGVVLSQLRAALPSVRIDEPPQEHLQKVDAGITLELTARDRPLRTDHHSAAAAALLTSLQPLEDGERLVVQWLIQPLSVPRPVRVAPRRRGQQRSATDLVPVDGYDLLDQSEAVAARRAKDAEPTFRCRGRIGVTAASSARREYLVDRVSSSYDQLSAPGVELRRHLSACQAIVGHQLNRRHVPLATWRSLHLNAAEVVAVVGWPVGITTLPSLELGGCRQLPPATMIPREGCVIGEATFAGSERPIAIAPADRLLHGMVTGPTGTGKSTLLASLISQDMQASRGVCVVDPKGDLVRDCLDLVPRQRVRDVVVLDPSATDRIVGLNLRGCVR